MAGEMLGDNGDVLQRPDGSLYKVPEETEEVLEEEPEDVETQEEQEELTYETDPEIAALLGQLSSVQLELRRLGRANLKGMGNFQQTERNKLSQRRAQINEDIDRICAEKGYTRSSEFDSSRMESDEDFNRRIYE